MATRKCIDKYGKPVAFYSDKHAVFRVSGPESRRTGTTQFGLALRELAIELIYWQSDAKLVKEEYT